MLVGCGKQTALDITKENYEKYGYSYANTEIKEMMKKGDITPDEVHDCMEFIIIAEYGEDSGLLDALEHLNTSSDKEDE